MEPIFKVGDIVRIANLQQLFKSEVPYHVASDMVSLSGMLVEIIKVESNSYSSGDYPYDSSKFPNYNKPDGCRYRLKPADTDTSYEVERWQWSSPMLKKASKDSNTPLRIKVTRKSIVLNFKN